MNQNVTNQNHEAYCERPKLSILLRELDEISTCKDFLQVQTEGTRQVERQSKFYNLDAVISVGNRVQNLTNHLLFGKEQPIITPTHPPCLSLKHTLVGFLLSAIQKRFKKTTQITTQKTTTWEAA